ncbi:MAG TPA: hypothetical protein VGD79_04480 [Thermoanaerobaculia bacterium]|jgi:hypothetical protein
MSTNDKVVSTATVSDIPNAYIEPAQARLEELRLMRDQIPRFTIPEPSKNSRSLSAAASVSPDFVERTIVTAANQKALVRGEGLSPAEIRDLMRYAEAFAPVADELEAFAHFVRYSVNVARNQAGFEALTIYSLAQRLSKRKEYAGLIPYVADMRRLLGRMRQSPEAVAQRTAAVAARAVERAAKAAAKVAAATPAV